MISIGFTYDKITPESASEGDVSEAGRYEPGGWFYPLSCYGGDAENDKGTAKNWKPGDLRAALKSARDLGISEPSQFPTITSPHAWFTSADGDLDYSTGEETRYSLHVDGATVATLNRIARILSGEKLFPRKG